MNKTTWRWIIISMIILVAWFLIFAKSEVDPVSKELIVVQDQIIEQEWISIYALWDSLTAWYQLPLQEAYPAQLKLMLTSIWYEVDVSNWWKSWEISSGLLETLPWIIGDAQPWDIAILTIWANDGMQSMPIEQLESNISKMIDILLWKNMKVLLWWMQLPTNLNPQYRKEFKELYASITSSYDPKDVSLVPFFLEWVAAVPELNLSDWIHPNKDWYSIIAKQLVDYLLATQRLETND